MLQSLALVVRVVKKSGSIMSNTTSSSSRERARAAARETDQAKLKVKQLMEKADLEATTVAQKAKIGIRNKKRNCF